jgi:glycosyltransferase involved in cell wall biosynthesis
MRPDFTLSVIVPVFNERLTIRALIDRVRAVPIRKEIIVVDDASSDGTTDIVRAIAAEGDGDPMNRIHAFYHAENAGKGAAIRTAIPAVSGDIALIQDADLEYDPAEYPSLIEPILSGHADVVFGSRFLGGPHRVLFFRHSMGNKLLTFLSNLFTDLNLTDMETCYKVFRTDVLRRLRLVSNRFGIEPEITAKVARLGVRVYEMPVSYHGREYWEGKKINWKDGVAAIWTILRCALIDDREPAEVGARDRGRRRQAQRYNDWVWSRLAPYVGDRVLEVECGTGTFTRYLRNHALVVATEHDPLNLEAVRARFGQRHNIHVQAVDWDRPDLDGLRSERFDTVLCLNALEYLEHDDDALATFANLLPPGARIILKVPAMPQLYGDLDRAVGHLRRYDRDELRAKLRRQGFDVEMARYVNLPGLFGWYLNSRMLHRTTVPGMQARLASLFLPWLRLEQHLDPRWGMTLLAVGRRQ